MYWFSRIRQVHWVLLFGVLALALTFFAGDLGLIPKKSDQTKQRRQQHLRQSV